MDFHGLDLSVAPVLRIAAALVAGGVIGLERTIHGRAAGFRTYALVCMGAAMAMLVAVYPGPWLQSGGSTAGDVTRVVQGILTGIGFLGAGVIVKYGFSVRGLTTAASVWTTAVIGVLIGAGYYWEAGASVLLVLGALTVFRRIEDRLGKQCFARVTLGVTREPALPRREIDALFKLAGLHIEEVSYGLEKNHTLLDYEYTVSCWNAEDFGVLAEQLTSRAEVMSFTIAPSHD